MFCRSSEASNGASEAQVPLISSGLGKIGVTRSGGMRRRFFAIQQALAEALRTLAPGGVLVISCLASGLSRKLCRYADMQQICMWVSVESTMTLVVLDFAKHGQSWAAIVNFRQVWPALRTDTSRPVYGFPLLAAITPQVFGSFCRVSRRTKSEGCFQSISLLFLR